MGAPVNAAARLEGLKEFDDADALPETDCRVLISEATAERLHGAFVLARAGSVVLRGFQAPIDVYFVVSEVAQVPGPGDRETKS